MELMASWTLTLSLAAGLTLLWAKSQRVQVALSLLAVCLPSGRWMSLICFFKGQRGKKDKGIRIPDTTELLFEFLIELHTLHSPSWHQPIDSKHSSEIIPF